MKKKRERKGKDGGPQGLKHLPPYLRPQTLSGGTSVPVRVALSSLYGTNQNKSHSVRCPLPRGSEGKWSRSLWT